MIKRDFKSFSSLVFIFFLIGLVTYYLFLIFGPVVKDGLTLVSCQLGDKEYVNPVKLGEGYCK